MAETRLEDGAGRCRGVAGRITALPLDGNRTHLALAGERRTFRDGERLRLSADAGSSLAPTIISSGTLIARHLDAWNVEAGVAHGALLVQT